MPYKIVKFKNGWRVRTLKKENNKFHYFSKKPQSRKMAEKQFRLLEYLFLKNKK